MALTFICGGWGWPEYHAIRPTRPHKPLSRHCKPQQIVFILMWGGTLLDVSTNIDDHRPNMTDPPNNHWMTDRSTDQPYQLLEKQMRKNAGSTILLVGQLISVNFLRTFALKSFPLFLVTYSIYTLTSVRLAADKISGNTNNNNNHHVNDHSLLVWGERGGV